MIHFCSGVDSYSCLKLQNQEFKTEHIATILETIVMLHIILCVLSGSWKKAEVPVQYSRSPSSADLGTKTLCGTERSTRDTTRPGKTQTEI